VVFLISSKGVALYIEDWLECPNSSHCVCNLMGTYFTLEDSGFDHKLKGCLALVDNRTDKSESLDGQYAT